MSYGFRSDLFISYPWKGKKCKISLCTTLKHMEVVVKIFVHPSLTSGLGAGEWTDAPPLALRKGKDTSVHLVGGWMGPRAGLEMWR